MNVADILDKAADLIEPEGAWTQGASARNASGFDIDGLDRFYSGDVDDTPVCWCTAGAIYEATSRWFFDDPAYGFFSKYIGDAVPSWNDAPERTQAEVVSKLREAAALAREQGK